jgi:hypothetical protein
LQTTADVQSVPTSETFFAAGAPWESEDPRHDRLNQTDALRKEERHYQSGKDAIVTLSFFACPMEDVKTVR